MTPLAQRYFKQLALPVDQRTPDPFKIRSGDWTDLHCFEVSAIMQPTVDSIKGAEFLELMASVPPPFFLPSPITWLEWELREGNRVAVIVREAGPCRGWLVQGVIWNGVAFPLLLAEPPASPLQNWVFRHAIRSHQWVGSGLTQPSDGFVMDNLATAVVLLSIVNTPGLVKLHRNPPHRGFETKMKRLVPGFKLTDWCEVKVDPSAVRHVVEHDGSVSFRKCLHFVRAHQRRLGTGRKTVVRAHWRGDPSLGIEQTRYAVSSKPVPSILPMLPGSSND